MPQCRDNFRKRLKRRKKEQERAAHNDMRKLAVTLQNVGHQMTNMVKGWKSAMELLFGMLSTLRPFMRKCGELYRAVPPKELVVANANWLHSIAKKERTIHQYRVWCVDNGWTEQVERIDYFFKPLAAKVS